MACGVDRLVRGASPSGPLATSNGLVTPCAVPHVLESCNLPCIFCMHTIRYGEGQEMWALAHHAALQRTPRAAAALATGDGAQAAGSHVSKEG